MENVVKKPEKKCITVVSEGRVFVGVRRPFAWTWLDGGPATAPLPSPASAGFTASERPLLAKLNALIDRAHLSKEDKRRCRNTLPLLADRELRALERALGVVLTRRPS